MQDVVRINIIGWYGTETIGDRGILGGLINIFSEVFDRFSICLGSLIPCFSERCLLEDLLFYQELSNHKLIEISIYDSTSISALKKSISSSQYLFFGGGPLMDIPQMAFMDYAFAYAKKHNIKTGVLGCGFGPLRDSVIIANVINILKNSDVIVFRDKISAVESSKVYQVKKIQVVDSIDPAVFCMDFYNTHYHVEKEESLVVMNFRDVMLDDYSKQFYCQYETYFCDLIRKELGKSKKVLLVPMHSFSVGGDDRILLYKLQQIINSDNLICCEGVPSLKDVMTYYSKGESCYGMRFHSVLFQILLNGNNIILDYTDPLKGKIIALLNQLGVINAYKNSYVSLARGEFKQDLEYPEYFKIPNIGDFKKQYINALVYLYNKK